ncbi:MobC family plasmid mobilization relaxosome protein [Mesorhizobium sp. 2RAF21]|uniref:MobC family plasmid mobilization relaxosome protein n=1 Tax=Mesorhizobium sp. 2RAF21 TaxID=3232995 RepID=UPI003F98AA5A
MGAESFEVRRAASKKDKVVRMRLSADELAAIEKAASAAEMTMSAFLRSLLLEGAGIQPLLAEQDRTVMGFLADEMRAVGTNLNQMARALNSGGSIRPADLDANIGEVQVVVAAVLSELRTLAKRAGHRRRGEG